MQYSLPGTTWKVVKAVAFDADGKEIPSPLGQTPMGCVMFGAERMIGAIVAGESVCEGQRPFLAYSGPYTFDGRTLITIADSASNPDMLVRQIREIVFETPTRITVSPVNSLFAKAGGTKLIWERVG